MTQDKWVIRPKYIAMVKRYTETKDMAEKIMKKHKFIQWISCNHNNLTDAELEYLQKSICNVEDIYY